MSKEVAREQFEQHHRDAWSPPLWPQPMCSAWYRAGILWWIAWQKFDHLSSMAFLVWISFYQMQMEYFYRGKVWEDVQTFSKVYWKMLEEKNSRRLCSLCGHCMQLAGQPSGADSRAIACKEVAKNQSHVSCFFALVPRFFKAVVMMWNHNHYLFKVNEARQGAKGMFAANAKESLIAHTTWLVYCGDVARSHFELDYGIKCHENAHQPRLTKMFECGGRCMRIFCSYRKFLLYAHCGWHRMGLVGFQFLSVVIWIKHQLPSSIAAVCCFLQAWFLRLAWS